MQLPGIRRWAAPLAALVVGVAALAPHSAFADVRDFTLINGSRTTITNLYVSPTSHDSWGRDWLGSSVLAPNRSVTLNFYSDVNPGECLYDLRIRSSDGGDTLRNRVNLCTTSSLTFR